VTAQTGKLEVIVGWTKACCWHAYLFCYSK